MQPLETLKVEEAYRFIFSIMGSSVHEAITLSKKDHTIVLHYLSFQKEANGRPAISIKTFQKIITIEAWMTLQREIVAADYWGLKPETERRGDDGSDLTLLGVQDLGDDATRSHYVHRWSNENLSSMFHFVYTQLLQANERMY